MTFSDYEFIVRLRAIVRGLEPLVVSQYLASYQGPASLHTRNILDIEEVYWQRN